MPILVAATLLLGVLTGLSSLLPRPPAPEPALQGARLQQSPTETAEPTRTPVPRRTTTPTLTVTRTGTPTETGTPTSTVTSTATPYPTQTPISTVTPTQTPVAFQQAVISEVHFGVAAGGRTDPYQWIEVRNTSPVPLFLDGWTVSDNGGSDALPFVTIRPHGVAVIAASSLAAPNVPPGVQVALIADASIGNGLSPSGDHVILRDHLGKTVDAVSWGSDATINNPACPVPSSGASLERRRPGSYGPCGFEELSSPSPGVPPVEPTATPTVTHTAQPPTSTSTPAGPAPTATAPPSSARPPAPSQEPPQAAQHSSGGSAPSGAVIPAFSASVPSFNPFDGATTGAAGSGPAPSSASSGGTSAPAARPPAGQPPGGQAPQQAQQPSQQQQARPTTQPQQQQAQPPSQQGSPRQPAAAQQQAVPAASTAPAPTPRTPGAAAPPAPAGARPSSLPQVENWPIEWFLLPFLGVMGLGALFLGFRTFREITSYGEDGTG